ncbi:MAG: hypothetical protein OXH19_09845 [Chloroflexi bacterium]|nr:hypothetical protein [Chloroflexota bacterium]
MTANPNPPTPRRCRRILEAHHLDCQGLSPDAIAAQLRCARSTVYAYFRDFQLHRAHILRTVAADRLADQVHILTTPDTEPDQHRQTVAATRELRLLLQSLPAIHEEEDRRREHELAAATAEAEARTRALEFETRLGPDGHERYIHEPRAGQCVLGCPKCIIEFRQRQAEQQAKRRITRPQPDQSSPNPDESAPIQTNLDKSGQESNENPAHDSESAPAPQYSPPRPRQPRNWPRLTTPHRPNRSVVIPLPDIGRY